MGLDFLDLATKIEETFDVELSYDDTDQFLTVGGLYDYIVARTELAQAGTCLTATAFYRIQAGLNELGISERFAPASKLTEILPKKDLPSFWLELSEKTELQFPKLRRPDWAIFMMIVVLVASITTIGSMLKNSSPFLLLLIVSICLVLLIYLSAIVTKPLATRIPKDLKTFRQLSERLVVMNAKRFQAEHGPMGKNDIWIMLRDIIVETLGVDHDAVVREAHLVKDLGCG